MNDVKRPQVVCGPCNDGICEWLGCSMPGVCTCRETHPEPDFDE